VGKVAAAATAVVIGLVVLGHLYYGWLLYQTLTSEANPWTKFPFVINFAFWLLLTVGLLAVAIMFLREKDEEGG